ncbi:MAG: hypothetical protein PVF66_06920 [Candidatus Aminicenantes bacterium]
MLPKKQSMKKNMAILACLALVSLFLPGITHAGSDSSDKSDNSTTSASWLARNLLISTVSVDNIMNGLITSNPDQNGQSDPRLIQGNSTSKKKPQNGGD